MNPKVKRELDALYKKHGVLQTQAVVDFARRKSSALHSRFEWDDSVAAEAHRRQQARELLHIYVTVIEGDTKPVTAYVSIKRHRRQKGGGYVHIGKIMTQKELREEYLQEALWELTYFRKKYASIKKLASKIDAVIASFQKKATKKAG